MVFLCRNENTNKAVCKYARWLCLAYVTCGIINKCPKINCSVLILYFGCNILPSNLVCCQYDDRWLVSKENPSLKLKSPVRISWPFASLCKVSMDVDSNFYSISVRNKVIILKRMHSFVLPRKDPGQCPNQVLSFYRFSTVCTWSIPSPCFLNLSHGPFRF